MGKILENIIFSFMGTVGFSILYNAPKEDFIYCGITGSCGWAVYSILYMIFGINKIWANFPAILVVAILSEIFARVNKKPVTLYIIPGIICFVPGYGIYNTMSYVMLNEYNLAMKSFLDTLLLAWLIAIAMVIVSSIFKIRTNIKQKKEYKI